MTSVDYHMDTGRRGTSSVWAGIVFALVLLSGAALSILAFQQNDISIVEAIAVGFAGVGGIIIGLIATIFGLIVSLIGAAIAVVATGGALALTAFIIGSPIIALILFALLMRKDKSCPDPSVHENL